MSTTVPHWIGGEAALSFDGAVFDNVAPATQAVVSHVARGGQAEVAHAVAAARTALEGAWGRTSRVERADSAPRVRRLLGRRQRAVLRVRDGEHGADQALIEAGASGR